MHIICFCAHGPLVGMPLTILLLWSQHLITLYPSSSSSRYDLRPIYRIQGVETGLCFWSCVQCIWYSNIDPPPGFSFLQTISKSVSSSSQSDIFHQILSSWWAAFGLVFKACALHPPTGQCWSKQRQEAAGYLSTTLYHINKCLQNKKRKYSKKSLFIVLPDSYKILSTQFYLHPHVFTNIF